MEIAREQAQVLGREITGRHGEARRQGPAKSQVCRVLRRESQGERCGRPIVLGGQEDRGSEQHGRSTKELERRGQESLGLPRRGLNVGTERHLVPLPCMYISPFHRPRHTIGFNKKSQCHLLISLVYNGYNITFPSASHRYRTSPLRISSRTTNHLPCASSRYSLSCPSVTISAPCMDRKILIEAAISVVRSTRISGVAQSLTTTDH